MKKIFIFMAFMISLGFSIPAGAAEEVQSDFFVAVVALVKKIRPLREK